MVIIGLLSREYQLQTVTMTITVHRYHDGFSTIIFENTIRAKHR